MKDLKLYLKELGFQNVTTYIQSGNVIVRSSFDAKTITEKIETMLPKKFKLDSSIIKVLVLTHTQLKSVIENRPKGFGGQWEKYHSDAIFLIGFDATDAMQIFSPREGVDKIWPGRGVIYSERLSADRTKSRLNKIMVSPLYKSMTIRNWNTVTKLEKLMETYESTDVTT